MHFHLTSHNRDGNSNNDDGPMGDPINGSEPSVVYWRLHKLIKQNWIRTTFRIPIERINYFYGTSLIINCQLKKYIIKTSKSFLL